MNVLIKLGIVILALGAAVSRAGPVDRLQQAIEAYQQAQESGQQDKRLADFNRAMRLFEDAAASGIENADLYTNLGTAALQAERLGPAVLAFRRALLLDPDKPKALQNLSHTRNLLPAWIARPEPSVFDDFFFWHKSWSADERTGIAAFCFLLAGILAAIAIRWQSSLARALAFLPALLWLSLMASLGIDRWAENGRDAVVMIDETIARAADSANAPARFASALAEGTEVRVLEMRERWARIALADGQDAWIPGAALALIDEHY